jgi:hypothetical protein
MTLHETTEVGKKFIIGSSFVTVGIISLVIMFRVGVLIKDVLFPPQKAPPNMVYGELPPLTFPESITKETYTYNLNTLTGNLPEDFPDRLNVFPIVQPAPNLGNLDIAKIKIQKIGLVTKTNMNGQKIQELIEKLILILSHSTLV